MAAANPEGQVEIDDVALLDGMRADLRGNSDFSGGKAHWFFSSDRTHSPWHIKNMFLQVLFDQGALGLTLLALLLLAAFWRVSFGLGGFLLVGLLDSLPDVPRIVLLFYLLLMVALVARHAGLEDTGRAVGTRQRR